MQGCKVENTSEGEEKKKKTTVIKKTEMKLPHSPSAKAHTLSVECHSFCI